MNNISNTSLRDRVLSATVESESAETELLNLSEESNYIEMKSQGEIPIEYWRDLERAEERAIKAADNLTLVLFEVIKD